MSKAVKFSDALKKFSASGIELLLLLFGIMALFLTARPAIISDGLVRYGIVHALLHADPLPRIKYSLVQPVLSFPLGFIAQSMHADAQNFVAYFNVCVFCILGVVLFISLCAVYSRRQVVRFFILLLGVSMFPHYLQHYYGEVFSALCICAGFALLVRNSGWVALLLALGIANTPPLLIPAALTCVFFRQRWAVLGLGVGFGLVLIGAENIFKYGALWNVAYLSEIERGFATVLPYSGRPGFSYPLFFGILSVLFSFGKGLVFYIPGVFLLFSRAVRATLKMSAATAWSVFAFCAALVFVYAGWWAWYGGVCWGPRFFLILSVPASMALAACLEGAWGLRGSVLTACVLGLSTWVGVNGVVFGQTDMGLCWMNNYELEFLCWYVPEFSALWRPFVVRGAGGVAHAMLHDDRALFVLWQLLVFVYFFAHIAGSAMRNQRQRHPSVAASSGAAGVGAS